MRRALNVLLVVGLFTLSFVVATPTSAATDDSGTLARVATVSVDGSDTLLPPGERPSQWWGPWPLGFWGAGWPSWGAWGGWPWWAGMPLWQISALTGYSWPWWPSWGFGGGGWGSPGGWGSWGSPGGWGSGMGTWGGHCGCHSISADGPPAAAPAAPTQ